MINIISRSLVSDSVSGPQKVVTNLIKGLDLIGYPYVINKRLDACTRLWIHDDTYALTKLHDLNKDISVIIGPNLFIRPRNVPKGLDISRAVLLFPSPWAVSFWTDFGFASCPTDAWPAGIDTDEYAPSPEVKKEIVLIYMKQRSEAELMQVKEALKKKGIPYEVITYGRYTESEYKRALARSRYVIWLGRHETQGIALEEALSTDTPILLCEVERLGHWEPTSKERTLFNEEDNAYTNVSAAPYFDATCGIVMRDLADTENALNQIETLLPSFAPRLYILDNLSLKKQAKDFVRLYEKHFGLSYESGLHETVLRNGNWINATLRYKVYLKAKKIAKYIVKAINTSASKM